MRVLSSFFRTKKMLAVAILALFALGAKAQSSQVSKTKIKVVTIENGQKQTKEIIIDGETDPAAIQKVLKENGVNDVELPPLPPPPPQGAELPPPPQGAEGQELPPPPPHHFKKIIITKTADGDSTVKVEEGFWPEHHGGKRGGHHRHHPHHAADSAHTGKHGGHGHHHRHHHHGDSTVNQKRVVIIQQTSTSSNNSAAARKAAKNKEISLYPNPSTGLFSVSYSNPKATADLTLTITDAKGKEVRRETIKGSAGLYEANVNLTEQAKGTYIIVLTGDGSKKTKKVVIE
ncbi:Por secretion system C-terminal sorting domain-containing protein [Flexibacter flexilis DSM 6793]|uniref:Por secretion system C-terminal sorting domain-containing protein n=1 Tax=Flexibacter flexilis DSM 6793 TaxID=927664 RepID=A0A1I1DTK0_9BACT|nr:T9SS type A sorting domain-containing protein [Flexibacter flexilis]SFB77736.1 Por secretion system C-terminal sorting domain-containing protein [Flexibacter flexilis DSM 6793]